MLSFIKLLRPLNLLIIILTMYAIRFGIIKTFIDGEHVGMILQLNEFLFALSVLMMVLLAAAGNIINDYFDVRVDRINKPKRVKIGITVKRRVAMVSHYIINFLAFLIAVYLAYRLKTWYLVLVPVIIGGLLWFYSLNFKKETITGNIVVGLIVAFVPIWAGALEMKNSISFYGVHYPEKQTMYDAIWIWILVYSLFAFLFTIIREVQKDMEDVEGDTIVGYHTIPISWGIKGAKIYTSILILITLGGLIYLTQKILDEVEMSFWFKGSVATIVVLLLISLYFTLKGKSKKDYGFASDFIKVSMLVAVLFAFFFKSMLA